MKRLNQIVISNNQVALDNNNRTNIQRWREFAMSILWFLLFAALVGAGIWLYVIGKDLGRELLIVTVSAAGGFAAGYGTGQAKR